MEVDDESAELEQPYWFESDHVALKGNPDYHKMLQTVALLVAQRAKAIKDLEELMQKKDEALADPIGFVAKLQNKENLDLPERQPIAELPRIDWRRYSDQRDVTSARARHGTRQQKQQQHSQSEQSSNKSSRSNTPTPCASLDDSISETTTSGDVRTASSLVIRGKAKNTDKPATFNKLWTLEEQAKLEELLVKYPEEDVEARRWEKIAKELGNRTRQQVQSRVQKYFIRLARERMPIPGRVPHNLHGAFGKRKHANTRPITTSTFCAAYKPPVYMSDDDDTSSIHTPDQSFSLPPAPTSPQIYVSDEEDVEEELRDSEEYAEMLRLKRLKKAHMLDGSRAHLHEGYQCDRCGEEPIRGTRFHCQDCPSHTSTDLCQKCSNFMFETPDHKSWHSLAEVKVASDVISGSHLDQDYSHSQFTSGDYNYLDPNYMPAT